MPKIILFIFLMSNWTLAENNSPRSDVVESRANSPGAESVDSAVSQCLGTSTVPEGKWVSTDRDASQVCERGWLLDYKYSIATGHVKYRVRRLNGRVQVSLSLYMEYAGDPRNRERTITILKSILPCVMDLYKRNGIDLDLSAKIDTGISDLKNADARVKIWDSFDRSSSNDWSIIEQGGPNTNNSRCGMIGHEVGHLLGLPDRYVDPDCKGRPSSDIGPVGALMNSGGYTPVDFSILLPADIRIIAAPLCTGSHL